MDRPPDPPRRAFDIFYDADLTTEEKLRDLERVLEYWEGDESDDPYSGEAVHARLYMGDIHKGRRWGRTLRQEPDSDAAMDRPDTDAKPRNLYFAQALHCVGGDMTILHAERQARRPENELEEAFTRWYSERSDSLGLAAVARQASMKSDDWPGVGKVDLEILCPDRCWIEFKWGDLWNCPWDLAKLALAVREGLCRRAYLVAAAPTAAWNDAVDGAEYFGFGRWDTHDDVILRYRQHWLKWKRDVKTRPLRLPATIFTDEVTQPKAFRMAGVAWQVRMTSVRCDEEGWITVDEDRWPHRLS